MTDTSQTPLEQPGLDALRKERERADALQKQLKELQSKVQSGDILASELQQTKALLSETEAKSTKELAEIRAIADSKDKSIAQLKIEQQFNHAAAAVRLNPAYQSLLLAANRNDFKLTDDGTVVDSSGKSITDWMQAQREQLPELFEAPGVSGSGARSSRNGVNGGKKIVSRNDPAAFISNLDAIADGTIITE